MTKPAPRECTCCGINKPANRFSNLRTRICTSCEEGYDQRALPRTRVEKPWEALPQTYQRPDPSRSIKSLGQLC